MSSTNPNDQPLVKGIEIGTFGHLSSFAWQTIEGTQGTFDFSAFDTWVGAAPRDQNGVAQVIIAIGKTPSWAVSNQSTCNTVNGVDDCTAPPDNISSWTTFIETLVSHYNGVTAPHVAYYEIWNEANNPKFWTGTNPQLVALDASAYSIIHNDPYSQVLMPSTTLAPGWQAFIPSYLNATDQGSGIGGYTATGKHGYDVADIGTFHAYLGLLTPVTDLIRTIDGHRSVFDANGMAGKPMINSEGGWGDDNITDPDQRMAYAAAYNILQASEYSNDNLIVANWYSWGGGAQQLWGTLENSAMSPTLAGFSYSIASTWLVGNSFQSPCSATGSVWTCNLTGPNNFQAQIVWDMSQTCSDGNCTTSQYSVPAPFTQTLDLNQEFGNGVSNQVAVGLKPVLLTTALRYLPIASCRVADTRTGDGSFGGPYLIGGVSRAFELPRSACGIPSSARAYSLNLTAVPLGPLGYLTTYPCGEPIPPTSTLNSVDGRVKAAAAIMPAGIAGAVCVRPSNDTDLVLDINGYFVPATDASALSFYPLTPCRVADTRKPTGPLGGPYLPGGTARDFPVLASSCGAPSTAQVYSLNITVVPRESLGYVTAWPTGQLQPNVSTLNAPTAAVTANASTVQAGANGEISVFASNDTDLVIDITGYFAPPSGTGLSLYPVTPCRLLDTRHSEPSGINGEFELDIVNNTCNDVLPAAQAYLLNATVVPEEPLGYLTLWPQGENEPLAASLNASDGVVTSNMAIIPTTNGSISVFASNPTQLVLDTFGFLAP